MKSSIFWHITPCSPLKVNRRFGGTFLHLQLRKISLAKNQREAGSKQCNRLTGIMYFIENRREMKDNKSVGFQSTTRRYTLEDTYTIEMFTHYEGFQVDFEDSLKLNLTPWLWSTSELYQPSDRRLLAKLVLTFADRGCRVVSVTDFHGL
jgi:hypothetical protein